MTRQKTALISVYHKEGLKEFAESLISLGWKIISSGGTAKYLSEAGIEVTNVYEITGMGAILSHRVVTLHPKLHGGLLALDTPEHLAEMEKYGIPWIDMVCVDFYPLEEEIKKPEATPQSVLEKTDIGGPTMIRSAAKGRRIVICEVSDRVKVIDWLKAGEPGREAFISHLSAKAEFMISRYCAISAGYHSGGFYQSLSLSRADECAYGENAWQKPAYLAKRAGNEDVLSLPTWQHVAGNAPSYNNWCDIDRMIQTLTHIGAGMEKNFKSVPYAAVGVKHGNACGASFADSPREAISKMLEGDLRAIFGGSVMVNFPINGELAELLVHSHMKEGRRLLDVVAGPSFTKEAIEILSRKKGKCRLVVNKNIKKAGLTALDQARRFRYVRGGFLQQPNYTFVPDLSEGEDRKNLSEKLEKDIIFSWAVGSTSNSNTITIVKGGRLVGNGVGQQDRVGAAKLAILRADEAAEFANPKNKKADLKNTTAYSDSFFPFPDAPQVLIKRGVKTIFSTSGSVNDEKVIKLCKAKKVNLILLPDAEARGFYQH